MYFVPLHADTYDLSITRQIILFYLMILIEIASQQLKNSNKKTLEKLEFSTRKNFLYAGSPIYRASDGVSVMI